jgi:hypothetical protein
MSAPASTILATSSLSAAEQAARKTQPALNCTVRCLARFASDDSAHVSDSCQRFSCSARLNSADDDRSSRLEFDEADDDVDVAVFVASSVDIFN